jgi:hypothetical protein
MFLGTPLASMLAERVFDIVIGIILRQLGDIALVVM